MKWRTFIYYNIPAISIGNNIILDKSFSIEKSKQ